MFSTLNMKNFIIAGHEHSTRDSRGQRLISISHLKYMLLIILPKLCHHGQKFEACDIAQAHLQGNMVSDTNIKLLAIAQRKYNGNLLTKYFKFVPLIHDFALPNLHIGRYLRFFFSIK